MFSSSTGIDEKTVAARFEVYAKAHPNPKWTREITPEEARFLMENSNPEFPDFGS